MKEAMWGLGLVMLSMLTIVIIGVVSNVTLTNQQDYYGVKQTSEASTYDSKNEIAYIKGICVCGKDNGSNIKYTYLQEVQLGDYNWKNPVSAASSDIPYTVSLVDEEGNCQSPYAYYTKCEARIGEYVIDPDVFTESVIARLGSIIKPTEVYDIKVQEVIPYPPKISVYISYHQALNNGGDAINAEIPNQIDAVIEDTGTQAVIEYQHNDLPDLKPTCGQPETVEEDEPENPTEPEQPTEEPEQPINTYSYGNCKAHYHVYQIFCEYNGSEIPQNCHVDGAAGVSACPTGKPSGCNCTNGTYVGKYCTAGMKYFNVFKKGTYEVVCSTEAADVAGALSNCKSSCAGINCVAKCHN